jgi:hypothetical protein
MKRLKLMRVCDSAFHFNRSNDFRVVADLGMTMGEFSQWIAANNDARRNRCQPLSPSASRALCL